MQPHARPVNDPSTRAGLIAYVLVTVVLIGSFLAVFRLNDNPDAFSGTAYSEWSTHYVDADQYALLADALAEGRFTLDLPVPDELAALESPYRIEDRMAIASPDVPIFWDHAFYEGSYYCYFGVVPAILVFEPYQLVTGEHLYTPTAVKLIGVLAIIALSLLAWHMGRRYFRGSATVLTLGICLFALYVGSCFAYHAFVPRFYSVPIVSSLLFTALGLWFWLGAARSGSGAACASGVDLGDEADPIRQAAEGETPSPARAQVVQPDPKSLSIWHLAAGSACMALNLGCRPQFILAALLALPLFKREILETRELFSRKGLANTAAAIAPFVLVFIPLLAYNYARFGSVFDFGSSYNLTGFDMTEYDMSRMLTIILFATYLFGPLSFSGAFPFVAPTSTDHPQWGWAPNEPFYGGFFLLMPVQILALLLPVARGTLKQRGLFGFCILCFVLAPAILLVDTRIAGITQRYFSDFGLYIALVACLVLLSFQAQGFKSKTTAIAAMVVLGLAIVFTIVVGVLTLFSPDRYDAIASNNPALYSAIASWFS